MTSTNDALNPTEVLTPPGFIPNAKPEEDAPRLVLASQWRLMWWKFRKHRLALVSLVIIIAMYIVAIFA